MKQLEHVFIIMLTTLVVLTILLILDALLLGVISLVTLIFDKVLAVQIFKWGLAISFGAEFIITVPISIKTIIKGSD